MEKKLAIKDVKTIGIVGTGKIGAAWAAHFLAQGLDVIATDPSANAENQLRIAVENAWPSLEQLGMANDASPERLQFSTAINGALNNVDFVQVWTAVSVYVLVAIIKKRLNLDASLYTLLQVFSVTLFEKIPLNADFFDTKHILEDDMISNQLNLFNN